jgi:hypothetical protein
MVAYHICAGDPRIERLKELEKKLLQIDYVSKVEFDLLKLERGIGKFDCFVEYNLPFTTGAYFFEKQHMIEDIFRTASQYGLQREGEPMDVSGDHLYFTFVCEKDWLAEEEMEKE